MSETKQQLKLEPKVHDLFDFMVSVTNEMASEYDRIQKRATEDPGTAGDQGEENWKKLFQDWLPPAYQIVTKGRILGHTGEASPQVDVLILRPEYPVKLLNTKVYLAGGVAAAFECKLTLKAEHISDAITTAADIRRLAQPRTGSPYRELFSPLLYGVLAHSHSWQGENSDPIRTIIGRLFRWTDGGAEHPRELIDVVSVSDLGTFSVTKGIMSHPTVNSGSWTMHTGYMQMVPAHIREKYAAYRFPGPIGKDPRGDLYRPIGSLLCFLMARLAYENKSLRELAEYFRRTQIPGTGAGHLEPWREIVVPKRLQDGLSGRLPQKDLLRWDEWRENYI